MEQRRLVQQTTNLLLLPPITQRAEVDDVVFRSNAPRYIREYELDLIYSGESNGDTDSKKAATKKEPDVAKLESIMLVSRVALSLAERHDIFGSSGESEYPSLRRSRMLVSDRDGGLGIFNDDDGDAVIHHDQDDRTVHGVGTSIDTTQEDRDCGILRVAPEKKAWLPPQRVLDRLSDMIRDRYRIRQFDS